MMKPVVEATDPGNASFAAFIGARNALIASRVPDTMMKAVFDGVVIADSDDARNVEGLTSFPLAHRLVTGGIASGRVSRSSTSDAAAGLFRFRSMQEGDELRRTVVIAAAVVAALDQVSKVVALKLFADADRVFGPLRFTIVRNPGGPFGVADGASLAWTAVTAAILIAAVIVIGRSRLGFGAALAVGVIVGGGLGNLVDRLVRGPGAGRGAVVDWISFGPYPRVFNLADVALRITALTVVVMMLGGPLLHRDSAT